MNVYIDTCYGSIFLGVPVRMIHKPPCGKQDANDSFNVNQLLKG